MDVRWAEWKEMLPIMCNVAAPLGEYVQWDYFAEIRMNFAGKKTLYFDPKPSWLGIFI
jgi:hypothetical protein